MRAALWRSSISDRAFARPAPAVRLDGAICAPVDQALPRQERQARTANNAWGVARDPRGGRCRRYPTAGGSGMRGISNPGELAGLGRSVRRDAIGHEGTGAAIRPTVPPFTARSSRGLASWPHSKRTGSSRRLSIGRHVANNSATFSFGLSAHASPARMARLGETRRFLRPCAKSRLSRQNSS